MSPQCVRISKLLVDSVVTTTGILENCCCVVVLQGQAYRHVVHQSQQISVPFKMHPITRQQPALANAVPTEYSSGCESETTRNEQMNQKNERCWRTLQALITDMSEAPGRAHTSVVGVRVDTTNLKAHSQGSSPSRAASFYPLIAGLGCHRLLSTQGSPCGGRQHGTSVFNTSHPTCVSLA